MNTDTVDADRPEVKMDAGFLCEGDVFYRSGCRYVVQTATTDIIETTDGSLWEPDTKVIFAYEESE